jgi:hypothetical protein
LNITPVKCLKLGLTKLGLTKLGLTKLEGRLQVDEIEKLLDLNLTV